MRHCAILDCKPTGFLGCITQVTQHFEDSRYDLVWFTDSNESVELRDENGIIIDKTPLLSDLGNDFTSWQRFYDGYDLDGSGDWKFVTSTTGSSNGKLIETHAHQHENRGKTNLSQH